MKTVAEPRRKEAGFSLMELMVAMAITSIIVVALVSITSMAMDTWNRSRSELRAARQGKAVIDSFTKDFESLVLRNGNTNCWLYAETPTSMPGPSFKSSNAANLLFFSAPTDRYDGKVGNSTTNKGGDVSAVAYRLDYVNPIDGSTGGSSESFVLNRHLVNPDDAFKDFLGLDRAAFNLKFQDLKNNLSEPYNLICDNIYQFTLSFSIELPWPSGSSNVTPRIETITISPSNSALQSTRLLNVLGSGIEASGSSFTADELKAGKLKSASIGLTILTDQGARQIRTRTFSTDDAKAEFLAKNSFHFAKTIDVPTP